MSSSFAVYFQIKLPKQHYEVEIVGKSCQGPLSLRLYFSHISSEKKKKPLSYHQTAIKAKNDWDILHKVLTLEWGF